jgi:hypothetical protein
MDMLKECPYVKNPSHFVAPSTIIYTIPLWEFHMFIIQEPLNALRSFSILICLRQQGRNNYLWLLTLPLILDEIVVASCEMTEHCCPPEEGLFQIYPTVHLQLVKGCFLEE